MKNFLLPILPFAIAISAQATSLRTSESEPCDTLFLTNGKTVAVKNAQILGDEIHFNYCEDGFNRPQSAPLMQMRFLKKAAGDTIVSPHFRPEKLEQKPSPENLSPDLSPDYPKKVDTMLIAAIGSYPALLVGVGAFLALYVFFRSFKLLRKIKGRPDERKLRRKLYWAIGLTAISGVALITFWLVFIQAFSDF